MPGDTLANVNAPSGQKAQFGPAKVTQERWDAIWEEEKPKKQPKKKKT